MDDVAAVDSRLVVLGSLLDPLHWAAEPLRDRDREVLLRVHVELGPEPAADVRGDDPDLRLRDAQDELHREAKDVRDLRRGPQRHLVGRTDLRDQPARLDRVRDQPWLAIAAGDDDVGRVDRRLDAVRFELPHVALVRPEVRVDDGRAVRDRLLDVRDRGELLVLDVDELGGVFRECTGLGDHHRDAVALVAGFVRCQWEVHGHFDVLRDGPRAGHAACPVPGEVGSAVRRHDALRRPRGVEVDACDARVRVRAPDDDHGDRPGQREVLDERPAPAEERVVLLALDGRADEGLGRFDDGHG